MKLTEEENSIASQILDVLNDIFISGSYEINNDMTLELVDNIDDTDIDFTSADYSSNFNSEYTTFMLDYIRKVVDFARPVITFTTVQHTFPRVKYPMQLAQF